MLKWSCQFVLQSVKCLSKCQFLRWNHYQALGLDSTATMSEIKDAYYKLSKKYHPDRNNGSEASAKKFRDIVAAYEVLSKPNSRIQYDREITRNRQDRNYNISSKNTTKKRFKKSSNSIKAKSRYKNDNHSKFKQKNGFGGRKGMRRYEKEDHFIIHGIPFIIAWMMFSKKR